MAEAEDVITDVARHATIYARDLWRRNRPLKAQRPAAELSALSQRLDLLIAAVFRRTFPLRVATPPARQSVLSTLMHRAQGPQPRIAVPATDGASIWLPRAMEASSAEDGAERYRMLALQQAARALRGSATAWATIGDPLAADCYLVLEAAAADYALSRELPGLRTPLNALRRHALAARPPLSAFSRQREPLENLLRDVLSTDCGTLPESWPSLQTPADSLAYAQRLAASMREGKDGKLRGVWLLPDLWTGQFRAGPAAAQYASGQHEQDETTKSPRSARLGRRPEVREPAPDEDDNKKPGAWMIQSSEPHEHAEDPMGLQRPTDRDESTAAEDFAESLSELSEARLVTTPGSPKEILISEDAPEARVKQATEVDAQAKGYAYPEWDYRSASYRDPGARVFVSTPPHGDPAWIESTLAAHRAMLNAIRRQFEMLRAQRMRLRKQSEGEDIDLDAYIEAYADFRAGRPLSQQLYQTIRPARRDTAIALLIDVSGSTDGWVSGKRRVIDVEREALLLVCLALESLGEPYTVQAFSGDGPNYVTVKALKTFDEPYGADTALRIAGLEPERYTRAGAAIRHTTALLMQKPARHRLLLLLSDGKPNDVDEYEGRYGVEDMRQSVNEAKLQGISPFCLTIDRQGAAYLPQIFGAGYYAMLMKPESLPTVLLEWIRRLLAD